MGKNANEREQPGNPAPLQGLFNDDNWSDCVDSIQIALQQHI